MHFSNHVDTTNGRPLPSKQCWNEETRLRQGKVYSPAQTTTLLGGWGKRGGIKADHISCPKSFVPHCSTLRKKKTKTKFEKNENKTKIKVLLI